MIRLGDKPPVSMLHLLQGSGSVYFQVTGSRRAPLVLTSSEKSIRRLLSATRATKTNIPTDASPNTVVYNGETVAAAVDTDCPPLDADDFIFDENCTPQENSQALRKIQKPDSFRTIFARIVVTVNAIFQDPSAMSAIEQQMEQVGSGAPGVLQATLRMERIGLMLQSMGTSTGKRQPTTSHETESLGAWMSTERDKQTYRYRLETDSGELHRCSPYA